MTLKSLLIFIHFDLAITSTWPAPRLALFAEYLRHCTHASIAAYLGVGRGVRTRNEFWRTVAVVTCRAAVAVTLA